MEEITMKDDAVAFARVQLSVFTEGKGDRWHYGRVELAKLLDAIFGGVTVEDLQDRPSPRVACQQAQHEARKTARQRAKSLAFAKKEIAAWRTR
jgi:hypothetical protein